MAGSGIIRLRTGSAQTCPCNESRANVPSTIENANAKRISCALNLDAGGLGFRQ
jgi:hypothetical protein